MAVTMSLELAQAEQARRVERPEVLLSIGDAGSPDGCIEPRFIQVHAS